MPAGGPTGPQARERPAPRRAGRGPVQTGVAASSTARATGRETRAAVEIERRRVVEGAGVDGSAGREAGRRRHTVSSARFISQRPAPRPSAAGVRPKNASSAASGISRKSSSSSPITVPSAPDCPTRSRRPGPTQGGQLRRRRAARLKNHRPVLAERAMEQTGRPPRNRDRAADQPHRSVRADRAGRRRLGANLHPGHHRCEHSRAARHQRASPRRPSSRHAPAPPRHGRRSAAPPSRRVGGRRAGAGPSGGVWGWGARCSGYGATLGRKACALSNAPGGRGPNPSSFPNRGAVVSLTAGADAGFGPAIPELSPLARRSPPCGPEPWPNCGRALVLLLTQFRIPATSLAAGAGSGAGRRDLPRLLFGLALAVFVCVHPGVPRGAPRPLACGSLPTLGAAVAVVLMPFAFPVPGRRHQPDEPDQAFGSPKGRHPGGQPRRGSGSRATR